MTTRLATIPTGCDAIYADAPALPPPPCQTWGAARVAAAAERLQAELDLLHARLREAKEREAREALRRSVRRGIDVAVKDATRAAQAREMLRKRTLSFDTTRFWKFVDEVLDDWREEASEARLDRDLSRANLIDDRVEAVCRELAKIEQPQRQRLWEGR